MTVNHINSDDVNEDQIKEMLEVLDQIIEKYNGCDICKAIG